MTSRLLYGGDYNPEQWDESVWTEDVDLMRRAGVNLVTVGVFSWGRLQPRPDAWDTGWLHRVVDMLWDAGIAVDLATPTASPPPWLGTMHPEALAVNADGVRMGHGSRNHFCPSSSTYREGCLDVTRRLGAEFGDHPAVRLWHIGNEYGQVCFCDGCAEAFRRWLRLRYDSLELLNEAWGTTFWSQHYGDWREIGLPGRAPYLINPAQALDHRRFASDTLRDCYLEQRRALLPLVGGVPITTNFMGFFGTVDYRSWIGEIDVVADDHYGDPADPDQPSRSALVHDLMRSLGDGPWLMMEQAMGAVNFRAHNVPKTDAQRRLDVIRAVARGADGVLSFQWRQARFGSERFHSAMLPNSGPDTRLHGEVRRLGTELAALSEVAGTHSRGQVAMLFDWESMWAEQEPSVPSRLRNTIQALEAWYRPLWERGVLVDVVSSVDSLDSYPLVLAPAQHMLRPEALENLRAHLRRGGHLVMGPFSAVVDADDALLPGPFPSGLTDLLGATGEQWWPLAPEGLVATSPRYGDFRAERWAEQFSVQDAEVVAGFDHTDLGPAIIASRRYPFTYVACEPPAPVLAALMDQSLLRARVVPDLGPVKETAGAEVVRRGEFTFVLNHHPHPAELTLTRPAQEIVSGRHHTNRITLAPGDVVALREETS